jgi:hypothetical protein
MHSKTKATGLPEPRQDHAVAMVNFARDIVHEMSLVVVELETVLGPGTAALTIRVGVSTFDNITLVLHNL